ncbi:MAG: esterase/lipase family protein [Gemmatirosa sp.]
MPVELTGSSTSVVLGTGYTLRAPGLRGRADMALPAAPGLRGAGLPTDQLEQALAAESMRIVRTIDLQITDRTPAGTTLRSAAGAPAVELETPDFGDETAQVLLAADESGVLRWHFPEPVGTSGDAGTATRGAGGRRMRYRIDAPPARAVGTGATRSLLGAVGRKVLKLLVYPVTDPIVGAITDHFAEKWEGKKRPYQLRDFGPDDYQNAGGRALDGSDAARLGAGRALLFVHGTFSTAHGGFGDVPRDLMQELHTRYGGRVLAFNHHTLSHDPRRNVEELLQRVPGAMEVDIVCHSRGGLVSRVLAERPSRFGLDTGTVKVRRVVFVGVPNAGTQLSDPEHMVHFLDRMTTALNLFPGSGVTDVLEGILTAVKVIGHGALKALDGLAAMNPNGKFLQTLNAGTPEPGVEYYAVASDYEPDDDGLRALLLDGTADRVFAGAANDLVVPQLGVFEPMAGGNAIGGFFPIAEGRRLLLTRGARVVHTRMFSHPDTVARLRDWLSS